MSIEASASAKAQAICNIGSIDIGEYLGIGIGGNFDIGAALIKILVSEQMR